MSSPVLEVSRHLKFTELLSIQCSLYVTTFCTKWSTFLLGMGSHRMMKIIHIGIRIGKRKLAKRNWKFLEVGVQVQQIQGQQRFFRDIGSSRSCWRYREFEKWIPLFYVFFKFYDYLSISKWNALFVMICWQEDRRQVQSLLQGKELSCEERDPDKYQG